MVRKHTVIIGNGIAGITTARHLRKHSDQRITVISAEAPYFFSRTALMYVYLGHMKFEHIKPYEDWFWEKNDIELLHDYITDIDTQEKILKREKGESIAYDQLVLATGSQTKYYDWPGQDLKGVQGLVTYQDLQNLEAFTPKPGEKNHRVQKAVIVGGGLIGIELAEMLMYRNIEVTMLVRENHFWGNILTENESNLIMAHARAHGLNFQTQADLKTINGDDQGNVESVTLADGDSLPCQLVGITTGVKPNTGTIKGTDIEMNNGIMVNEYLETNIPDVYAAGDCVELRNPSASRRAIEPVWYTGRMMGEVLGRTLSGKRSAYKPGPWFNSAKFFDIEYQTYGVVNAAPDVEQVHWFWKKEGENKFVTVAYHPDTLEFQGINGFGVRLLHAYFDRALTMKMKVSEVVGHMSQANFDTEFYGKWPREFKLAFTRDTGIAIEKKSRFNQLFSR